MFKNRKGFVKNLLTSLVLISSLVEAAVPNSPGPYVGVSKLSDTSVRISTKDNANDEDGFYISVYDYATSALVQQKEVNSSNNSYVYGDIMGLACDNIYSVNVVAFNNEGNSSQSNPAYFNIYSTFGTSCTTPPSTTSLNAPGPYIGVTATAGSKTSVRVNFLDNADNEDGFLVFDNTGDINVTVPSNNASEPSQTYVTLTGLVCNKVYTIKALAFNSQENSEISSEKSFNIHSTFGIPCGATLPQPPLTLEELKAKIANGEDVTEVNTSAITNMSGLFSFSDFNQDISNWDVSNVTDMNGMFMNSPFNQDISSWDVSNVTYMSGMFMGSPFNQDISSWDVSNVTNMSRMFKRSLFNQDISSWDVSNVTDMGYMFSYNSAFSNQDLSSWNLNSYPLHEAFSWGWGSGNIAPNWNRP